MSRNPERIAWITLWLSSLAFCVLIAGGWRAVDWYVSTATVGHDARLEILSGTVLLQEPGTRNEVNVPNNVLLREGARIRTTSGTQAVLWLFDGSNVRLWPETAVVVDRLRATNYNDNSSEIVIRQTAGRVRAEVARPSTKLRHFAVTTPNADLTLREGSYGVDVLPQQQTELSARYGSATVEALGHSVEVLQRERVVVAEGSGPSDPQPAAWNLVRNGSFDDGLAGWQSGNRDEEEPVPGAVEVSRVEDRQTAHFSRTGATKHAETFLYQPINRNVADYQQLQLVLDLKLLNQSLSGGGWRGSEYPLMVRLKYRDAHGSEILWVRGFYCQNAGNLPTNEGQAVPKGEWVRLDLNLFDPSQVASRPVEIVSLELSASGWDYESLVTGVSMVAE